MTFTSKMASFGGKLVRLTQNIRQFSTTTVARSQHWQQHGIPGSNLPFGINNRYKLTAGFIVFFASGFNAPFLLVLHQLKKK